MRGGRDADDEDDGPSVDIWLVSWWWVWCPDPVVNFYGSSGGSTKILRTGNPGSVIWSELQLHIIATSGAEWEALYSLFNYWNSFFISRLLIQASTHAGPLSITNAWSEWSPKNNRICRPTKIFLSRTTWLPHLDMHYIKHPLNCYPLKPTIHD